MMSRCYGAHWIAWLRTIQLWVLPLSVMANDVPMQSALQAEAGSLSSMEAQAASGDLSALMTLAGRYENGEGAPLRPERAFELYGLAARQGDAEAQFRLGHMYAIGSGTVPDQAWSVTYFRAAARQGHAGAQARLRQLLNEAGLAPDAERKTPSVAPLNNMAASPDLSSSTESPADLSDALRAEEDQPLSVEEVRAIRYARGAGIEVAWALETGADVQPIVLPAEALAPAQEALPSIAEVASAQLDVRSGFVPLRVPIVIAPEAEPALLALGELANQGDSVALYELANRFISGDGVKPDEAMAITLFREASRRGHATAGQALERYYLNFPVEP
jgi:TPR repeat protein